MDKDTELQLNCKYQNKLSEYFLSTLSTSFKKKSF